MRKINRDCVKRWGVLLALAFAGVLITTGLFSATRFSISAFEFSVELIPFQRGETVIFIPPVGELSAATHRFPFLLKITLLNVDLDVLVAGLEKLAASDNLAFFEEQLREKLGFFILRTTLLSFLCGAGAVFLLERQRRVRRVLLGGLMAALIFSVLISTTLLLPYNIDAFESPQYKGILGAAPRVVNLAEQTLAAIKTMGEQLEVMTANLHDLSVQLDQVNPVFHENGIRVLHVSDIHNNPAAFDFIEKVAGSFKIDLIIDTGDLTDYGTEPETELASRAASLPVPYLFVPGNHDSSPVTGALNRAGVSVLENGLIEIAGLRVAGIADPSSTGPQMGVVPESALREASEAVYRDFAGETVRPDLLAVHHPLMGELFIGKIPLILSGHTHQASVKFEQGSVLVNAGTAGAAGVRGLSSPGDNPYSVAVLYFNQSGEDRPVLIMVDLISVQQFQDSFTLHRYYNR